MSSSWGCAIALTLKKTDGTVDVDLVAQGVCDIVLVVGYNRPAELRWKMTVAQHTLPIPYGDGIKFLDSDYHASNPVFIGFVKRVNPVAGDPNAVEYVAYDPAVRCAEEVFITNGLGTLTTTSPRAVYNCKIDGDEDRGYEILHDASVGTIIADLLDNQEELLRTRWAAPAYPSTDGGYVSGDLTPLDYVPQEKVTFDSEGIISGVLRMLNYYPNRRMVFDPTARQHRVYDVKAATQVTLTLNQTASASRVVLSMQLDRNLDKRFTSVQIYGKPEVANGDVTVGASTLTQTTEISGPNLGFARRWTVADSAKRHLAKILANPGVEVTVGGAFLGNSAVVEYKAIFHQPVLLAKWPDSGVWKIVPDFLLRINEGVVETPYHISRANASYSSGPVAGREPPSDVRFVFGYYDTPLTVSYPPSGFTGTAASSPYNVQVQQRLYNEILNTGYAIWDSVTATSRKGAFSKLASALHGAYSDVIYSGGAVIHGIDYEFLGLNRRINITSLDKDGGTLTTGWEAANAILTEVEYDYGMNGVGATTLTFSGDMQEFTQTDPEQLRKLLKVRARERYEIIQHFILGAPEGGNLTMGFYEQAILTGEEG